MNARTSLSLIASILAAPAVAGTCLTQVMDGGGLKITSPYGVDRTGRATPGFHQGVDLVNNSGMGAQIRAGSSGPLFYRSFRGGGIAANVTSGDTKFVYLHMRHGNAPGTSRQASPGDPLGRVGCEGMRQCAPHLHLYALLTGASLSSNGYSGRTWREFSGKLARPMTGDQIKNAAPTSWYYVNPERFLPQRVPITNPYPDMEGGRRTQSLEPTCSAGPPGTGAPGSQVNDTPSTASKRSPDEAISGDSAVAAGSEDYSVKMADQPIRSLHIELSKLSAKGLVGSTRATAYEDAATLAMIQLATSYILDEPGPAVAPKAASQLPGKEAQQ